MEQELQAFEASWRQISSCNHQEWEKALAGIVESLTPTQRDAEARQYLVEDLNGALMSMGLYVRPFGSFLSNMGFPDSDVDLLLAGSFRGVPPYELPESGRKTLLRKVGARLYDKRLVMGQIEYVLRARVPLIKFVHARTGIECDLTVQSYDGALKGRFLAAVSQLDTRFPSLFRLVKLWARTHECNDASQATLNSTSLMYMCVFFLQRLGVLPPLSMLCPEELQKLPKQQQQASQVETKEFEEVRLLDPRLRSLWVESEALEQLIARVEQLASEINRKKAEALYDASGQLPRDPTTAAAVGAVRYDLTQLLLGFLSYWEVPFGAWAEGRLRAWRPDCWSGCWRLQGYSKAYLCPLEDPFDSTDNPARSVGSESVSPGSQNVYIAAVLGSNAAALRRLLLDASGPGGERRRSDAGEAVRVLQGLIWTLGLRGVALLRPPLPGHQLARLAEVWGDPARGSPLQRLLWHVGVEVQDEDILDHYCFKEYRSKIRRSAAPVSQQQQQQQQQHDHRQQHPRKQELQTPGAPPARGGPDPLASMLVAAAAAGGAAGAGDGAAAAAAGRPQRQYVPVYPQNYPQPPQPRQQQQQHNHQNHQQPYRQQQRQPPPPPRDQPPQPQQQPRPHQPRRNLKIYPEHPAGANDAALAAAGGGATVVPGPSSGVASNVGAARNARFKALHMVQQAAAAGSVQEVDRQLGQLSLAT